MSLFRHQRRRDRCSRPPNVPGRATYSSVFSTAWRIYGHKSQTCSSIIGRQVRSRIQVVPFAADSLEFGHFSRNGNSEALTESRLAYQDINKCPELAPTAPNRETRVCFSSPLNILPRSCLVAALFAFVLCTNSPFTAVFCIPQR